MYISRVLAELCLFICIEVQSLLVLINHGVALTCTVSLYATMLWYATSVSGVHYMNDFQAFGLRENMIEPLHLMRYTLTSSNISSRSSSCRSSFRDNRWGRWLPLGNPRAPPFWWLGPPPDSRHSFCSPMLRKVGVPSMVFTMGFSRPPRSNSWAEIFLENVIQK